MTSRNNTHEKAQVPYPNTKPERNYALLFGGTSQV